METYSNSQSFSLPAPSNRQLYRIYQLAGKHNETDKNHKNSFGPKFNLKMFAIHFSFTTVVDEMRLKLISAPAIGCMKASKTTVIKIRQKPDYLNLLKA